MFKQTSNGTGGSASHDSFLQSFHRRSGKARSLLKYVCLAAAACFASSVSGQTTSTSIEITRDGPDPSLAEQGIVVFTHLDFEDATPAPTGTITITDGTDSCTATLPETFCLYQPQTAGTKTLTADYSGDANFDASTSPGITHEVEPTALPERVSIPDGFGLFGPLVKEANMPSSAASVSADGRLVVFASDADNLVPGDINGFSDVFVQDRLSGTITRISTDFFGNGGNGPSVDPAISDDGQMVVYASDADNLVRNDSNGVSDIFVHFLTEGDTDRVSVDSSFNEGDLGSFRPSISRHGQFVAFDSDAPNLVPDDTNFAPDVFVRAVFDGTTERVSVDSAGMESDGPSSFASISADGQSVLFESNATNLVGTADTNGVTDVFVHDRDTDTTERVSISTMDAEGNAFSSAGSTRANLSDDGQLAVFETQADNLVAGDENLERDILLRDRNADTTTRITLGPGDVEANGASENASISANGGFVAFRSFADNLVADDTNLRGDIFVHDLVTGENEIASLSSGGRQTINESSNLPTLSADGQFVAFETDAANLINNDNNMATDVFVRDRNAEITLRASEAVAGTQGDGDSADDAAVSSDGRFVAFRSGATNLVNGDTNQRDDIFVFDRDTGAIERVSVNSAGEEANAISAQSSISDDGRFVAFVSLASNLGMNDDTNGTADIFVHDRDLDTTERVSIDSSGAGGNGFSQLPSVSSNGQFVAFESGATNLVDGDSNGKFDVFVRDLINETTERVSAGDGGTVEGDEDSFYASISDDGRFVAFESSATNLVADDTNGARDAFVHDRDTGETRRVSVDSDGNEGTGGNQGTNRPRISGNGQFIAFEAEFDNLVEGDSNGVDDIFVHDRAAGATERVSVDGSGNEIDGFSIDPDISDDGRFVLFTSVEPELDPDAPSNGFTLDVFVHDRETGVVQLLSQNRDGEATDNFSDSPAISGNGRFAAFQSFATNLVPGDSNRKTDVFVTETIALSLVAPEMLDFGDHPQDSPSAPQTITVESTGPAELVLEMLTIEGNAASDFDIVSDDCSTQSIGTQASTENTCPFDVTFTPSEPGVREAQIMIPSNSESSPDAVPLQGTNDVVFFSGFEGPQ